MMIAGGFNDISKEGSYEFANMKAISNAETEFTMGRKPTEMSRPAITSCAGVSGLRRPRCRKHVSFFVIRAVVVCTNKKGYVTNN